MLLPAEIESRTLIPALRAILSKRLSEKYNIHEDEISKMLEMASKLCEDEKYTQALKYYEDVLQLQL